VRFWVPFVALEQTVHSPQSVTSQLTGASVLLAAGFAAAHAPVLTNTGQALPPFAGLVSIVRVYFCVLSALQTPVAVQSETSQSTGTAVDAVFEGRATAPEAGSLAGSVVVDPPPVVAPPAVEGLSPSAAGLALLALTTEALIAISAASKIAVLMGYSLQIGRPSQATL
jgi:hypothetical protein